MSRIFSIAALHLVESSCNSIVEVELQETLSSMLTWGRWDWHWSCMLMAGSCSHILCSLKAEERLHCVTEPKCQFWFDSVMHCGLIIFTHNPLYQPSCPFMPIMITFWCTYYINAPDQQQNSRKNMKEEWKFGREMLSRYSGAVLFSL